MQIRPEQIAQHVSQGVAKSYLLTGSEPLILQECADSIRAAARAAGCTERERIDASDKDAWQTHSERWRHVAICRPQTD